jgi:DNA-binding GntR family transcriptional regulator
MAGGRSGRPTRKRATGKAAARGSGREGRREPRRDGSLTDRAFRQLEEMIVTLKLAPGADVSEAELSTRLRIGRTPIREALQRLAREKLVTILPRRGIIVTAVDVSAQLRLLEVRREVERLLSARAARRATETQRRRFAEIADGMAAAAATTDDITFMRLDREFNLLVLEAAGNEFAAAAMQTMQGLSRRFWYIHYRQVADLPLTARQHGDIARAIAAGDEAEARAALDRLMDYIETFTRQTVEAAR